MWRRDVLLEQNFRPLETVNLLEERLQVAQFQTGVHNLGLFRHAVEARQHGQDEIAKGRVLENFNLVDKTLLPLKHKQFQILDLGLLQQQPLAKL